MAAEGGQDERGEGQGKGGDRCKEEGRWLLKRDRMRGEKGKERAETDVRKEGRWLLKGDRMRGEKGKERAETGVRRRADGC